MPIEANYLPNVREQYEELPYPERKPADEKKRLIVPFLSRLDNVNHHCFRGAQDFKNFRVLVAGGGTGDAAICWAEQLRTMENAQVVYLDMSTASTGIAQQRAKIRRLENIEWINDSLLNLPSLGLGKFDFIDCSGVLHHLKDPDAGLKALAAVLRPGGAISLMVYGKYGRTAVYMIQELMRLVNGEERNPRVKIRHTKEILKSLPNYHWLNESKQVGWSYSDAENDAGVYDLFLHEQDRAYTILEVHDWLDRCALKMASEPGCAYGQIDYLPETHIKDRELLNSIGKLPLKERQAIAEAVAAKITRHEIYAVHVGAGETVARIGDTNLVPWAGMVNEDPYKRLGDLSHERRGPFEFTDDLLPDNTVIDIPGGKFITSILRSIDGRRSVAEVVEAVRSHPKYAGEVPDRAAVMAEFEVLFTSLNRAHLMFLRHPDVEPFATMRMIELQMHNGGRGNK
jgi:ubiquinone/menaquinone biosynthesis C-methylase UbiE